MKNKCYSVILLLLVTVGAYAQRQTSSPFSRYGYGELYSPATAYNQSMGGIGVGLCNPVQANFSNPAAQAFIRKETFLFNVEVGANFRQIKDNNMSASTSVVGLESFSMAFPVIANRWGMALGLLPFNSVGYDMTCSDALAEYNYKGDGGINQIALSTGVRIFKGLSLGGNLSYMFGTTSYVGENHFTDDAAYYARKELDYKSRGIIWGLGLQYNWEISEEKSLTFGVTYRTKQSISYEASEYFGSYITNDVVESQKDTAILRDYESDSDIPQEIAFGASAHLGNRYVFGIDAGLQDWKDISVYGSVDSKLSHTTYCKIGCEIVPDYRSTKYIKRMPIRFGIRYAELPFVFESDGETAQAKEFGCSLGTQLKSRHTQNSLTFALEGGLRGNKSLAESLHETFLLLKLNVTLQEVWFTKRKIN